MRDERQPRRTTTRRQVKGTRRQARTQLSQLRYMKVSDALRSNTKPKPIETSREAAAQRPQGESTMFKVVPSPDDPNLFIVQSDPMPREEADKKAKTYNALEQEEEGEGEGEKGMPGFKPEGAMPPFAKKPAGPAGPPPMGGGGMPPMFGGM